MKSEVLERFLRYVAIETTSEYDSTSYPSTECQHTLLDLLCGELRQIGCTDIQKDSYGYATATIEATAGCKNQPVIGFLAHVDTSPDMSGRDVRPQIVENFDPTHPLPLANSGYKLSKAEFSELELFRGHTIITTDGQTLLGADDKAGVAEIMTAARYLIQNPTLAHGKIRIGFTPDEEIGRGVDHFDIEKFGAAFAYTIDSGIEGAMEYENFNAAKAVITITGRNIHPGYAKGRMVNALDTAVAIHSQTDPAARPETTEGREGFVHLHSMCGTVDHARMEYIIRDHDRAMFEKRKARLCEIVEHEPAAMIDIEDQYYNMYEVLQHRPDIVDRARKAIQSIGVKPIITPIRGGTDGARLSLMGLPCPNIFTGGMNPHSRFEYVSLDSMERAVKVIVALARSESDFRSC